MNKTKKWTYTERSWIPSILGSVGVMVFFILSITIGFYNPLDAILYFIGLGVCMFLMGFPIWVIDSVWWNKPIIRS